MIANEALKSPLHGTATGAGAMTADLTYFLLMLFLANYIPQSVIPWFYIVGGAIMIYFAYGALKARLVRTKISGSYLNGLKLGLTNPYQITWWIAYGIPMIDHFSYLIGPSFFLGILIWIFSYPYIVHKVGGLSDKAVIAVKLFSFVVLLALGSPLCSSTLTGPISFSSHHPLIPHTPRTIAYTPKARRTTKEKSFTAITALSQRHVRYLALKEGKVVLVPTPRLRGQFHFLDPKEIDDLGEASTIAGASKYGRLVDLEEIPKIDLVVVGSVAVTLRGDRVGKGEGYSELEWAILREVGKVSDETPVATTVHEVQIVNCIPVMPYDVPVDVIATDRRSGLS